MKEEDANKKVCLKMVSNKFSYLNLIIAGAIPDDVIKVAEEMDGFCIGSRCMMWQKKDISETSEEIRVPKEDGWQQADSCEMPVKWFRWVAGGDCGLKHKTFKRVGDIEISE